MAWNGRKIRILRKDGKLKSRNWYYLREGSAPAGSKFIVTQDEEPITTQDDLNLITQS